MIVTDHRSLKYLSTKRLLNMRQAGWAEFLSQFKCGLTYRPGSENAAADALSRHDSDTRTLKQRQEDERTLAIFCYDGQSDQFDIALIDDASIPFKSSGVMLSDQILRLNAEDPAFEVYRDRARLSERPRSLLQDKYILYKDRLAVPANNFLRTRII